MAGESGKNLTQVRWTTAAVSDLKSISDYIERQRNLGTANRVCRSIYGAVQNLRLNPESGKVSVDAGTRELVVPAFPSYVVVYRLMGSQALQVLRIWHAAQDRWH